MKHRLHNANKNAGPDFPGGADEIVMDSPLYLVRRFSPLVAKFAASFGKASARRTGRRTLSQDWLVENLTRAVFSRISTLKFRQTSPIQERRETVSSPRKRLGRKKQAGA